MVDYKNIAYQQSVEKEFKRRHTNKLRSECYRNNKEQILEEFRNKYKTKNGRAKALVGSYKYSDREQGRGECTLTAEQLINLWDEGCFWCGETDWKKLGADRIENDKPHTLENCVCSCWACNDKRGRIDFDVFKKLLNK